MRGCVFIFNTINKTILKTAFALAIKSVASFLFITCFINGSFFTSAVANEPGLPSVESNAKADKPEEDDFKPTPYTRFGELESEDEEEDLKFFQHGRFFGVSVGGGYQGATGNRGLLYQGGMPAIDVKVHAWFDFNVAMTLGVYTVRHNFVGKRLSDLEDTEARQYDVNLFRFGFDLRYYFDTKDLSAPITFAGPYFTAGVGIYSRSLNDTQDNSDQQKQSVFGLAAGGGLEFVLKPKKTYFNIESKIHVVNFEDNAQPIELSSGQEIPNSNGLFWSLVGSFLFTW